MVCLEYVQSSDQFLLVCGATLDKMHSRVESMPYLSSTSYKS